MGRILMNMKLSIVIVSWNVKDILCDCLDSIVRSSTAFAYEIIIVDNASTDGTADHVRKKYPSICIIENSENQGFARASNQGALQAQGQYLFFLNPDTILFDDTLSRLVEFMESNPDIALCGPRIQNDDGTLQESVRNFPSWRGAFYRYTILKYLGLFKSHFQRWHNRGFDYNKQTDIDQLIGAAILIRKGIFEQIGGFDERYFVYYEEVDLCHRLKTGGYRMTYYPGVRMIHLGGKSTEQIPAKTRFMRLQSLLIYFRKNTQIGFYMPLSLIFKVGVLSRQIYEILVFFAGFQLYRFSANSKRADKCYLRYKSASDFLYRFYLRFLFC
jgi:GT2 family glycosyltransferase